jgi:hypothetical protein
MGKPCNAKTSHLQDRVMTLYLKFVIFNLLAYYIMLLTNDLLKFILILISNHSATGNFMLGMA